MRNIIWVASAIWCLVLYEMIGCHFSYDSESWSLVFLATPLCVQLTWYSDFTFNTSLVIMTIVTNLLTAVQAGRKSRQLMNAAGIKMSKRQRQRELNFIKQTFFQGTTIFTGQVTYYIIAPLLSNPVIIFIVGTLWAFMHAAEG
uniref:7TM_GPCR_Srx domain-containing protein n=1 Tax=Caenorhabditis tropicalis TaxID=1561998 RepID=A0A1I7T9K5_9PELO